MTATAERRVALPLALSFVLVAFAANSLITRHVVRRDLLDAGLLSSVRFLAGAVALVLVALARRERVAIGRANVWPAVWLGAYAMLISYGYRHIGAAPGTFVFYAMVFATLLCHDAARGLHPGRRRLVGAALALSGIGALASAGLQTVTVLGVVLLAGTGVSWGLYTAAGRGGADARAFSTSNFTALAIVLLLPTAAGFAAGWRVTATGLAWAIVMGAGTTAFAYVAWYACQRAITGAQAGLVQLAIPVLTSLGAVLLLDEPFGVRLGVAAILVFAGLALGRPTARA